MLIVFVFEPETDHLLPLVPIARILADRGHEVVVVTNASGVETGRRTGFVVTGPGEHADLVPDVIVRDRAETLSVGGALPPRAPTVTCSFGITDNTDPVVPAERLHVCLAPPSYAAPVRAHAPVRHARPPTAGPADPGTAEGVLATLEPELPIVLATLGTLHGGTPGWFEAVIDGLAGLDLDLVCALGSRDPSEFPARPANVHLHRRVPQAALLSHCSLMLSHGGVGGVMEALACGVPLVLSPLAGDHHAHTDRCLALGVARRLDPGGIHPALVRETVVGALADSRLTESAGRIAGEIGGLPGPEAVAGWIEAAATGSPPEQEPP